MTMADCMTFPDTLDEFLEHYQFRDEEEVYTNGAMLIPVFRVKQWAEHLPAVDAVEVRHGEWIIDETFGSFACSICGSWHAGGFDSWRSPYCPKCGARMDGRGKE